MSANPTRPDALEGWRRGVALALGRIRPASAALVLFLSLMVGVAFAVAARSGGLIEAPSRAVGLVLRWVVPLSAFAWCSLSLGRARLDDSVWPIAALGVPRRQVVLGVVTVTAALAAVTAVATVAVTLALAYRTMPGLVQDLATTSWVAALGASAYVGWLFLGASFWRLGRGRWVPLLLDFTLGATSGLFAVVWPRPHLVNLAGGDALLDMSQPTGSVVLAAMTVAAVSLAALRAGD